MDASYKIQRGIHVHLIQFFMCPEFWVHITSIPSFYYYNGILEGYRQSGLPTASLKQAWEHCVEEVHRETERINRSACGQLSSRRKKDRGR